MPLSAEEIALHGNFSSNNRIKRSLSSRNIDYELKKVTHTIDLKNGKLYL